MSLQTPLSEMADLRTMLCMEEVRVKCAVAAVAALAALWPGIALRAAEPTVTLVAVGDIMLSRNVDKVMAEQGSFDYPFEKSGEYLRGADIAFANLETAITPGRRIKTGEFSFRADPKVAKVLASAGFDVLSLANNHTPNFGAKGLRDTIKYLQAAGIQFAGAGENASQAHQPAVIERQGLRFAFLAYNDTDVIPKFYAAGVNRPGTAVMDISAMRLDVQAAKAQADFVIVSMHSGTEYVYKPNQRQTKFARAAIDAGAELVIGHHPHVVQTFEKYKGKYILYSLGNFVFDQMWSQPTRDGVMAKAFFTRDGVQRLEFLPVVIENYSQPRVAGPKGVRRVLGRLGVKGLRPGEGGWWGVDATAPR